MFDLPPLAPDHPLPLQQSREYAFALDRLGRRMVEAGGSRWILRRGPAGLALAMAPRVRLKPGFNLHLAGTALERAVLLLSPDRPAPWLADMGALPLMTPGWLAEWHLDPDPARRRAALCQKWRNRLNAAEQTGLKVERALLPLSPTHWLLQAEMRQARARHYHGWPTGLTLAYAKANRRNAQLFTASLQGRNVAAILVLRHGDGATYHIGHTDAQGRRLNAHNLLMWAAADWLAQQGCRLFDLGLLDAERACGLARFKLGTGATARPLGGTWLWWSRLGRTLAPLSRLEASRMS